MRYLVLLVSLSACKASLGGEMGDAPIGSDDASGIGDGSAKLGPWTAPTPVEIAPVGDDDPTATGDLLELYFNRTNNIYVTRRASLGEAWAAPTPVDELNTLDNETTPEITYDGLTMYLASNRAGTLGLNDIWRSTRTSRTAAWSAPVQVSELCSTAAEGSPTQSDPLIIMIDTDRAGATLLDIFWATRPTASSAYSAPTPIDELNSAMEDGNPMQTADRLVVYFDSNRSGDRELYVATRASITESFDAPAKIMELTSTGADTDPWISPDGRTMYFTSDRDGTLRLWQTTR